MMSAYKDINELLDIARSINEGNYDVASVDVNAENELFHIAQYFSESIEKLQTVYDTVEDSYEDLPGFEDTLKAIISDAKTASENVLSCVDKITFVGDDIRDNLKTLKTQVEAKKFAQTSGIIDRLRDKALSGQDSSFDIIASLEFQDITKQKIDKLVKIIYDLQERLSHLVIMYGVKEDKIDIEALDKIKSKKDLLEDQNLVDELMKEFGQ
ncbi:putative chemotaxis phosphatase, CheZ [Denitrovibrio acetiphilus DSM 12809]|jgi:chemotaxis protein CheZ|uniref:Putative chemotaxis phosphatase, CheZ n=1 Tax=Denitrovibrio acetiphilus (strain DSM 12809 / NBRC 114555 / N2460) TaxID=522772 RepID=D4H6C9_DENA2|nr:protein phosphatase CheZ [Denitrovibrio acetiphilus]ADD69603.1 putative chemotaxis phosphatase, CheZ [Denitrovibrio acetiphilus DSM 12809]